MSKLIVSAPGGEVNTNAARRFYQNHRSRFLEIISSYQLKLIPEGLLSLLSSGVPSLVLEAFGVENRPRGVYAEYPAYVRPKLLVSGLRDATVTLQPKTSGDSIFFLSFLHLLN